LRDENGGELGEAKWMVVQEYLLIRLELDDDCRKLLTTNLDQRGARHMGIDRGRDRDMSIQSVK
jgi:hypothetical protein